MKNKSSDKLLTGFIKPKRTMQNVRFNSLDEFFNYIPRHEFEIIQILRDLILECIPNCKEKLSWNVPYYFGNSGICFLWPSSVSWGNVHQKATVRLGFMKGYLLNDELNYLDKGNRKQVYWKDFSDPLQIDITVVRAYIQKAIEVDQTFSKVK